MSRFLQQIIVPEIGNEGQDKISKAKVLVAGAGGLGIPVAAYLASSGLGNIGIADGDSIAVSNLQRQFLYNPDETGLNKSIVLHKKLQQQNPEITIQSFPFYLNENNAEELLTKYEIICDCTDNVDTRILLDRACAKLQKPLVYAAVRDWEGYLTVLNYKKGIRLDDIFSIEELKKSALNNCSVSGIVSTTCGTLGSLQAAEALKIILNLETTLDGKILCINTLANSYKTFNLLKNMEVSLREVDEKE